MNFDPFVLWENCDIASGRGLPDHPHRGFEAITYIEDAESLSFAAEGLLPVYYLCRESAWRTYSTARSI